MLRRVFFVCEVNGLNQSRLLDKLKNANINVYNVKKSTDKSMIVWIKAQDYKNFFAISKEMCYNVKKLKTTGLFAPISYLIFNPGLIIGALIFLAINIYFSGIIFSFSFEGSGKVEKRQITEYLYSQNVKPLTSFNNLDLKSLSDKILANNDNLSFAEVKKQGNRLIVYTVLAEGTKKPQQGPIYSLLSDVDGVVEEIKVYRGSAVVTQGQSIKKGDLLVDGYSVIKDKPITVNVIAKITVLAKYEFKYYSKNDKEENYALIFAEQSLGEKTITDRKITKTFDGKGYIYEIELYYKHIIKTE